jgi:isoquinoline 1-oxidoreductase alpha subunit
VATLKINKKTVKIDGAVDETPLLWILRDRLGLTGTKFGCGRALCGACMVHMNGVAVPSCTLTVEDVGDAEITTIEGLSEKGDHPVQRAWAELNVAQCGYCQSGQMMAAAALLAKKPNPTEEDIVGGMSTNICRCGTYPRIRAAIARARELK